MSSAINHAKRSHRSYKMHYSGAKNMKRACAPKVKDMTYGGGILGRLLRAARRFRERKNGDVEV